MLADDHAVVPDGCWRRVDAEPGMWMVADMATAGDACAVLREESGLDAIR